jgi:DNA-binding NarL/FixJ family response regulator
VRSVSGFRGFAGLSGEARVVGHDHGRELFDDRVVELGSRADDPPEQLLAALRTVAAGDALLSPAITKRVIERFTRIPRPTPPSELDELTAREREVLRLITQGLSNAEIGRELYISGTTVKTHVTRVLQKLNLRDRVQAVVLAYQTGFFEPDGS